MNAVREERDVVQLYKECGDFKKAVALSGQPALAAHIRLLASGVLTIRDKINYGSRTASLGGQAEELFARLVPDALDANRYIKVNNPAYDFMYGDLTIDVKFSSLHRKGEHHHYWLLHVNKRPDVIVAFLESDFQRELENPIIVFLPQSFICGQGKIHLTKMGERVKQLSVDARSLRQYVEAYHDALYTKKAAE